MGKQPNQFIPVKYVNAPDEGVSNFMFNLMIGSIAVIAFYNVYKGRNGPTAGKNVKGRKSNN